jgi:hypothetical protein
MNFYPYQALERLVINGCSIQARRGQVGNDLFTHEFIQQHITTTKQSF